VIHRPQAVDWASPRARLLHTGASGPAESATHLEYKWVLVNRRLKAESSIISWRRLWDPELRKRSRRPLRTFSGVDFSLQGSSRLIVLTPSSYTQSLERSSRGLLKPDCAPSTQVERSSRGLLKPDCAPSAPFEGFGRDLLKLDCTTSTTRRSNRDLRLRQQLKLLETLHRRSKPPGVSNSSYESSRRLLSTPQVNTSQGNGRKHEEY